MLGREDWLWNWVFKLGSRVGCVLASKRLGVGAYRYEGSKIERRVRLAG